MFTWDHWGPTGDPESSPESRLRSNTRHVGIVGKKKMKESGSGAVQQLLWLLVAVVENGAAPVKNKTNWS